MRGFRTKKLWHRFLKKKASSCKLFQQCIMGWSHAMSKNIFCTCLKQELKKQIQLGRLAFRVASCVVVEIGKVICGHKFGFKDVIVAICLNGNGL